MTRSYTHLAAFGLVALALTTTPAYAQRNRRDGGGNRDGGNRAERAQPRDSGQSRDQRAESRDGAVPQQRLESRDRAVVRPRASGPAYVAPVAPNRGYAPVAPYRGYAAPYRGYAAPYRGYAYPYVRRPYVYAVPYGYRPYGYRPGWSLNLYFGAPYSVYGYPAYGAVPNYGYYSVVPGRAYGAVRIVDAPRDAQVFVDGYYAGVVDDYDGVFQHLNLEAGSHHLEIQANGYPASDFDVRVEPGQTVTFHAYRS